MDINPNPVSAALGAEISGVDLGGDFDDAEIAAILDAWHTYQVLVFRGQDLSQRDQLRFTERLGTVGVPLAAMPTRGPDGEDVPPGIMLVTNLRRADGSAFGQPHEGEMWFHSDMCYAEEPHKATLLYGVDLPSRGGHTCFANMYKAYENLPADTRRRIDGRTALQVHEYRRTERPSLGADMSGAPHYAHPAVITHPATGRKALFVNRLMTARIEGMTESESDALLEQLFDVAEDPAIVYEHVWRPGDLVMWDNRCTNHCRTDFPAAERRLLRRTTVGGARPA